MVWSLQALPELSDRQFDQWSKLLEERTGMQLVAQQKVFLQTQITMRMREIGCDDYGRYYQQLLDGLQGMVEWSVLVDRLVVKETTFFRHRPSVEYVRRVLQERINNQQLAGSFDIWSVGCATGEEPYSLAMAVNDCFGLASLDPYYGITATDISVPSLSIAREGLYPERRLDLVTQEEQRRYFSRQQDGRYKVSEQLADRICFSHGNVMNIASMPAFPMDVIFCQNMLVYFRRWRRREILNNFVERLKPGGLLVIGLGEIVGWENDLIERVANAEVQAYIRR